MGGEATIRAPIYVKYEICDPYKYEKSSCPYPPCLRGRKLRLRVRVRDEIRTVQSIHVTVVEEKYRVERGVVNRRHWVPDRHVD